MLMEEQHIDANHCQIAVCNTKEETVTNHRHSDSDKDSDAKLDHVSSEETPSGEFSIANDEGNIISNNDQLLISDTLGSVGSSYLGSEDELKLNEDETASKESSSDSDVEAVNDHSIVYNNADAMKKDKDDLYVNSDEEDTGATSTEPPRSKHEVKYQDLPVEPLSIEIPQDAAILEIGHVQSIVDELVVVQSTMHHQVLDMDSVLCFENRTVLGRVFETFGPVRQPLYSVRLDASEHADKEWVLLKKKVYFVPDHSRFVHIHHLNQFKGCDASNRYDEELPQEEQEFSDDEKEADARKKKPHPKQQYVTIP
jgi:H/ACA ribonucleoprotein complex non-core subunit NAF1